MPIKILFLEDNPDDVRLAEAEFKKAGLQTIIKRVDTEQTFKTAIEDFSPHLILSDYNLPSYDGLSALKYCSGDYPETPIIIITGSLDEIRAVETMKAGAWDYILKENLIRLVPAIRNALKLKEEKAIKEKTERALRESEEKLRIIIKNSSDIIFQISPAGKLLYVSPNVKNLYGYEPSELIGRHYRKTTPRSEISKTIKIIGKMMNGEVFRNFEIDQKNKNGDIIPMEIYFTIVREGSKIVAIQGVMRDISERKKAVEKLTESEKKYRNLVENIQEGLVTVDENEKIIYTNSAAAGIFGYSKKELLDKNLSSLTEPKQFQKITNQTSVRKKGVSSKYELNIIKKDGNRAIISITASPLFNNDGEYYGSFGIFQDITKSKKAELRIKKDLKEKIILLQEIHHRVKNNLQIISSMLNLQSYKVKTDKELDLINDSRNRIITMSMIHEQLYKSSDLANVDFGEYLNELTSKLFYVFNTDFSKIALEIKVDKIFISINEAIPCGLIVNELVTNALKHAFPGDTKGKIIIEFKKVENHKILIISDNGIGLPDHISIEKSTSVGFTIIRALIAQLQAEYTLNSKNGTSLIIKFQKPAIRTFQKI